MITPRLTTKSFWDQDVDAYLFFLNEKMESIASAADLSKVETYYPHAQDILKHHKFEGKKGQVYSLTALHNDKFIQFFFVGVGKQNATWNVELETLRRTLGTAVQMLKKNGVKSALFALPPAQPYNICDTELLKQIITISYMAEYQFADFKKELKEKNNWVLDFHIHVPTATPELELALQHGVIMGTAINKSRTWCDTPANVMTPTLLSQKAQEIADANGLSCTIFGKERALELGMGSFLAVESGSDQDGKFVILEYKSADKNAPTVSLVGKGITFDTGGISLKPSSSMSGMKYDMSGAAAVIATLEIISKIKPNINVVAVAPLTENMPSGKAARQDDIVIAMNGKSIEINNTDAEGRLILADALCYTEKFHKPDVIIDVATLTGACLMALGYFYTGLMTQNEYLLNTLPELGKKTGDRVWPLPLDNDFKAANRSTFADLSNTGSQTYKAGTIIGACFLSEFVEKTPWAHLDIAGTADGVPDVSYTGNGKGSAGAAIRLLTEFILQYKKQA